jgi:glyceraldehyde-3-phosphate dehydrogenase/erythrose-4-phosphate dehydrogenase
MENDGEYDLKDEQAKHEHIKRQISEIKLQLIRGQTHKAEDVEAVMTDMFARFRSQMEALPSILAKQLENRDRLEIQKILKTEIDKALLELASYSPEKFYSDEHIDVSDEAVQELLEGVSSEEQAGG